MDYIESPAAALGSPDRFNTGLSFAPRELITVPLDSHSLTSPVATWFTTCRF